MCLARSTRARQRRTSIAPASRCILVPECSHSVAPNILQAVDAVGAELSGESFAHLQVREAVS